MGYVPVRFHDGVVDYAWEEPSRQDGEDEVLARVRRAIAVLQHERKAWHLPGSVNPIFDRFSEPFGAVVKAFEELRELRRAEP